VPVNYIYDYRDVGFHLNIFHRDPSSRSATSKPLFGFGDFQSFFSRNPAGFAVAVYNNILTEQCLSLQFFPYGFSKAP
jgi:hypothetical protein